MTIAHVVCLILTMADRPRQTTSADLPTNSNMPIVLSALTRIKDTETQAQRITGRVVRNRQSMPTHTVEPLFSSTRTCMHDIIDYGSIPH